MQTNEIKTGRCYATAENQHRKVTRIDGGKVWYETYRADVPGTWKPHMRPMPRPRLTHLPPK